jgi:rhamnose utilization protein RhaD (predicted bifunctional aldolase and dehydrogenase)/NAD(P)-dependent dehydrogenase (short-subunit alcohol dehydrogenase family)
MQSKWSDSEAESLVKSGEAAGRERELSLRVYTSRLIGAEPTLVLHGGGNTSLKTRMKDDLGESVEVVRVKASGYHLGDIEPGGLPALRLQSLRELRRLAAMNDDELANALRIRMLDSGAPNPSVEALLHAFLPHKYIDHSHADAILSLVDQPDGERLCREVFGDRLAVVPYVMSGFELAKKAVEAFERDTGVQGLILMQHGLFTFGDSARESYERHVETVEMAEAFIRKKRPAKTRAAPREDSGGAGPYRDLGPILRGRLGEGERRHLLCLRQGAAVREFVDRPDLKDLSQRGVVTPDHVIRTKRLPLLLDAAGLDTPEALAGGVDRALAEYRDRYRDYVKRNRSGAESADITIDPDPRIILVPGLGLVAAGPTMREAEIAADIYEHTVEVILNAEAIGSYRPIDEADTFRFEHWTMEQAKLDGSRSGALSGHAVYVTGAASGIGEATARLFAKEGACLYLVDRDREPLSKLASRLGCACEAFDIADEEATRASIDHAAATFGGLDGAVSNAGYAPQGLMDEIPSEVLRKSFDVNFFAHQAVAAAVSRVLKLQGTGGYLLFNASKAAFNPGAEFGPYALPKAAVVALTKQYALEGGRHGIRCNAVNADRIRTGIFSTAFIEERARARGVQPDAYFKSNLLRREVTAFDVAQAFLSLAVAESTTGCVITVDGGNIAASPR